MPAMKRVAPIFTPSPMATATGARPPLWQKYGPPLPFPRKTGPGGLGDLAAMEVAGIPLWIVGVGILAFLFLRKRR